MGDPLRMSMNQSARVLGHPCPGPSRPVRLARHVSEVVTEVMGAGVRGTLTASNPGDVGALRVKGRRPRVTSAISAWRVKPEPEPPSGCGGTEAEP